MSQAFATNQAQPLVRFYRVIREGLAPIRADRSALGTLPASAFQYCEPVCAASALGWYSFSPMDFHVQSDGTDLVWTTDGDEWNPVMSEHFPGLSEYFDEHAPADVRGYAPPFLSRISQPGVIQIWTGHLVRTQPGWSILVRPPANVPRSQHYELYEGIIETDRFFYPLFVNVRIVSPNRPILFEATKPLVQVQAIPRALYSEKHLQSHEVTDGLDAFEPSDWEDYRRSIVARSKQPFGRPGRYATETRKRARSSPTHSR
jgi:hypothetical protein